MESEYAASESAGSEEDMMDDDDFELPLDIQEEAFYMVVGW